MDEYFGKNRPSEMCAVAENFEGISIGEKAKKIRNISSEVNEMAFRIQNFLFTAIADPPKPIKETTCLDDELNGIFEEMNQLCATLLFIIQRLG